MLTLEQLAEMFGITFEDGMDEAAKVAKVKAAIAQAQKAITQPKPEEKEASDAQETVVTPEAQTEQQLVAASRKVHSPIIVEEMLGLRLSRVNALIEKGLTPATAKKIKDKYCTEDAMYLALSRRNKTDDAFTDIIATMEAELNAGNRGWRQSGRENFDGDADSDDLKLSHGNKASSPLLASRKKRQEQQEKRNALTKKR